ncbi:MAG TPA: hypothetical protein VG898_07770 [Solirubrobacterales bacterium]|nr:hypothetical protein [Solirubrobacterales bacterium]
MARFASARISELDSGLILAPERYDPTRRSLGQTDKTVGDLVHLVSAQINQKTADPAARYLVLDTGDAREGIVVTQKEPVGAADIRSPKKGVEPGDVIISRLRPYLKQVAVIDAALWSRTDHVVCSTEFYVLRAKGRGSLGFLVPWLLAEPVQAVLAAAQEGGHHPRFNSDVLRELPVPDAVWSKRGEASKRMEKAVKWQRQGEQTVRGLIETASTDGG